ncbi:MAG: amidophosphoribosyltransferase [Verrucomicrobiae bacterium]|nr:amidophosphoribosyltransferase [Verrucomicrobiae bacterium]
MQNYPKHYCGLFGIYGHEKASELTYYGIYALQHRGQESAGIVSAQDGQFYEHRGMGLVAQIFNNDVLPKLKGSMAIGHTRYSTTGSSNITNAQPLVATCGLGKIAIAHNGNLTNACELRERLEETGSIFQTTTDSEIIVQLLARKEFDGQPNNLITTIRKIKGAYSLVIMTPNEIIGIRDPHGFRPLSLGKLGNAWVLASETCAFDLIGAEFQRDIRPGEILVINKDGLQSINAFPDHTRRAFCIFEYVYFARPDSILANSSVYKARVEMGRQMARENPVDADIIVPIPDSGNCAALGFSLESGIPYEMAFVRNHYVGRSFIQPSQVVRDLNVKIKLNLIKDLVQGKRVVIVDDSIVRGTTCKRRVMNLKKAGAKEVHVRISCPPHRHPCVYGIDFPDESQLMAAKNSIEEIRKFLHADSLAYLSLEGMVKATCQPKESFCLACFDGNYPVKYDPNVDKLILERRQQRIEGISWTLIPDQRQIKLFEK